MRHPVAGDVSPNTVSPASGSSDDAGQTSKDTITEEHARDAILQQIAALGAERRDLAHRYLRNESDLVDAIQRLADWDRTTGQGQPTPQFYAQIRDTTGLWQSRQGARQWCLSKRIRL